MKWLKLFTLPEDGLNEIIFENRNRAYGAYVLRRNYNATLLRAFLISLGILAAVAGSSYLGKQNAMHMPPVPPRGPDTLLIVENIPEEPEEEQTARKEESSGEQSATGPVRIVPEPVEHTNDSLPADDGSGDKKGGNLAGNDKGNPQGTDSTDNQDKSGGTGKGQDIGIYSEIMPEFPGGYKALKAFIAENIVFPREGKSLGRSVKVTIRFVVGADGVVTMASAVNEPIGYGFEEEALKVVNKMPRWTPGMQNKKPVAVYYTLPIRFELD